MSDDTATPAFVDRDPLGCKCGPWCEFPCWQRVGLTSSPCCIACAPLPDPLDVPRPLETLELERIPVLVLAGALTMFAAGVALELARELAHRARIKINGRTRR